ncbi:inorganic phosphate transporter [Archangium primigenium]|uniref:inorganic phosphate transporter n=1 Tax=[Archangium] primigenium TaxID=2792470 RepID=UPI00195C11E9|nr:inorganic phosphate transporter [Archangium primigenium]MBM7113948.1 inorganic phosphate transporter [Archangium primigenium]
MSLLTFAFVLIGAALIFDFLNGFHDAANSVATVVTTRVLTPRQAVLWAAFFNFVAAFFFGTTVAKTISEKLVDPQVVDLNVIFGALVGAVVWDLLTWWWALPTSSSHAVISGLAGAAIAKAGWGALLLKGWVPVLAFLVLSPIIGMVLGWSFMTAIAWLTRHAERHAAERRFRHLQLLSAGLYSLGHGTNDAQKTMGIIVAILAATGHEAWSQPNPEGFRGLGGQHEVAWWIVLSCHGAMALGTMAGGWRIVQTVGSRITPYLRPVGGFSAELAAATSIAFATLAHVPISTTHAIGGAVSGVGATRGLHAVRWIWGKRIAWAWVLTFPGAALIGAAGYALARFGLGPFVH